MYRAYPLFTKFWAQRSMDFGPGPMAELYQWNGNFITYLQGTRPYDGLMAGFPE
jgi:hypothetical protein